MLQKKQYLKPQCMLMWLEEQDVVTLSDGVTFNAQDYGWWGNAEGGMFE